MPYTAQLVYASSQDDMSKIFYQHYKNFTKKMIAGNRDYIVVDMICDTAIKTFMEGKPYTALLTQDKVDAAMKANREKALREYYNQPTRDGGVNQIVKWGTIRRNETFYLPQLCFEPNTRIALALDPARTLDNSILSAMRIINDKDYGYMGEVVNCVNFVDQMSKKGYKLDSNRQLEEIRNYLDVYNGIDATQRGLGKLGKNLEDQFKEAGASFTQWLSVSSGIMALVYQLQKMPKEVIKVNSAMVKLIKSVMLLLLNITKYFDEAAKSAKRYGSSVSDLISATADWSRLGYNLPDSKKLAEVATLYKNVDDGIDIDTSNESLVSTLQGFKLEADNAMHIIDAFNEVGNNFAIGSDGIGEALRRSAASMYAAGNTLEETIGLVTAANAVVQDPDSIGTAYKTISMRIRGAKTEMEELGLETDGMVESTATLQKEIMALSGVDIMKDKDTFKSTYQILDELATKWQDLTDIQQASITELIAGKRQGNIISALMSNFETARQANETAINSTGSALKEQEAYEKGIQYSLDRLEASFQTFANHVLDSDFLKGIVDFGNGAINVLDTVTDKLGSLGTIGLAGGGYGITQFIKNLDCQKALKIA